jgi:hypothetical protein
LTGRKESADSFAVFILKSKQILISLRKEVYVRHSMFVLSVFFLLGEATCLKTLQMSLLVN